MTDGDREQTTTTSFRVTLASGSAAWRADGRAGRSDA